MAYIILKYLSKGSYGKIFVVREKGNKDNLFALKLAKDCKCNRDILNEIHI